MSVNSEFKLPESIGIATLAVIAGISERQIARMAEGGSIPPSKKGLFPCAETLRKLVEYYREMNGDNAEEMAREKLRKMTADADNSQMQAAQTAGEIMLTADAETMWGDRIVTTRQHIERAAYIPEPDRKRLLNELAALKFEAED